MRLRYSIHMEAANFIIAENRHRIKQIYNIHSAGYFFMRKSVGKEVAYRKSLDFSIKIRYNIGENVHNSHHLQTSKVFVSQKILLAENQEAFP